MSGTAGPKVQRRLAAIFAADVEGYSRLMGVDEAGTLRTLRAHREIMDRLIAEHGGRIANTAGDSVLAEFPSVVEAVQAAIEIQEALRTAQKGLENDHQAHFRIGVHVGDVIVQDGDLFGEAVNIAARLQALSGPGEVSISSAAYAYVRKALPLHYRDLGPQEVKNISEPVGVFAVSRGRAAAGSTAAALEEAPRGLATPEQPSIAVLPFANATDDPGQEYLVDGIVDELITNLYRAKWLFVIARSSSFAYKGLPVDVRKVGRELGVRYVLEGGVRKSGNRIRITARLVDATTGRQIWSDRIEDSLEDIFDLQDRIAESVLGAIEPTIRSAEVDRARAKPTESLGAYDLYLRALPLHYSNDRERLREAQQLLSRAIELDPTYSRAKAFSALTTVIQTNQGWTGADDQQEGIRLAREALADRHDDPVTLRCAGHALAYLAHEHDTAVALLGRALELNPSSAEVHHSSGWVYNFACEGSKAAHHFQRAIRLSPLDREIGHSLVGLSFAELLMGRNADALATSKRAAAVMPTSLSPLRAAIVALVGLDQLEEANRLGRALLQINPGFRISEFRRVQPFKDEWFVSRYMDALRAAGLPM